MKIPNALAVRLLTIILTPLAGALTAYLAKQGLNLPAGAVVGLGITASLTVAGVGLHWLQSQPKIVAEEKRIEAIADQLVTRIKAEPGLLADAEKIAGLLGAQTDEIVSKLGEQIHAPASVVEVVKSLLDALEHKDAPAAEIPAAVPAIPAA